MQGKQSKNLRGNISETQKTWQDKNTRKKHLEKENCQEDLWQENCLDGQTKDITRSIREGWKEIENGGKGNDQEEEEWKQLKKKKKSRKKNQELENRQKKIMTKWAT